MSMSMSSGGPEATGHLYFVKVLLGQQQEVIHIVFIYTRRYSPLCGLSSSSCKGLRPSVKAFSGKKRAFNAVLGNFWVGPRGTV